MLWPIQCWTKSMSALFSNLNNSILFLVSGSTNSISVLFSSLNNWINLISALSSLNNAVSVRFSYLTNSSSVLIPVWPHQSLFFPVKPIQCLLFTNHSISILYILQFWASFVGFPGWCFKWRIQRANVPTRCPRGHEQWLGYSSANPQRAQVWNPNDCPRRETTPTPKDVGPVWQFILTGFRLLVTPKKVVDSKGVRPIMTETFRLRMYNKLPKMGPWAWPIPFVW